MSALEDWNQLPETEALACILACCGSKQFASKLVNSRPFRDVASLLTSADEVWQALHERDWLEAFACHPRIGESPTHGAELHRQWSKEEQIGTQSANGSVLELIQAKNQEYEARHGFIYLVCASGKTAEELLAILDRRLDNPTAVELQEAAEQQRQITHIRLRKWLTS
jgi:OHCU decarboxylase